MRLLRSAIALLALAAPAGLAAAPAVAASTDTVYLKILWIRCQDQSEPFSDEIRLYVNHNWAGAWNDVDTRETHWVVPPMPRSHAFSGSTSIEVFEEDGNDEHLLGWVNVSEGEVNQGEHEGVAAQIDGEYVIRYVVESNP